MNTQPQISPVMRGLSAYIAAALRRPLPPPVTKRPSTTSSTPSPRWFRARGSRRGESDLVREDAGRRQEASVIGSRIVTTAVNAALANGMLAHADETDDSHAPSLTHPGCGIVPAALAMAERERRNGTALPARGRAGLRRRLPHDTCRCTPTSSAKTAIRRTASGRCSAPRPRPARSRA